MHAVMPRRSLLAVAAALMAVPAVAQQAAPSVRLRGTLESVSAAQLVLKERSGERIELALAPNLVVTEAFPVAFTDIRPDSFIGAGAMPQPDGSQKAIAVLLFPEAMRGTGEGHRPFDFLPQSTMTNATVTGVATTEGRRLKVSYKGGEQVIVVPPEAPVFSLRPGTRELLVPGGFVSVTAQAVEGRPTALRITAGRNGFSPPY